MDFFGIAKMDEDIAEGDFVRVFTSYDEFIAVGMYR